MATAEITLAWLQQQPTHIFQTLKKGRTGELCGLERSGPPLEHTHTHTDPHRCLRVSKKRYVSVCSPAAGFPFDCCSCGEMIRVDVE